MPGSGRSWEFRLLGSNLTNQIGLTEGNARFGGNTVQNNVGMGRSIVGREVNLTAKYMLVARPRPAPLTAT